MNNRERDHGQRENAQRQCEELRPGPCTCARGFQEIDAEEQRLRKLKHGEQGFRPSLVLRQCTKKSKCKCSAMTGPGSQLNTYATKRQTELCFRRTHGDKLHFPFRINTSMRFVCTFSNTITIETTTSHLKHRHKLRNYTPVATTPESPEHTVHGKVSWVPSSARSLIAYI